MTKTCKFCLKIFELKYKEQKFCSLLCANRFNLNNKNKVKIPPRNNELAEFFGILLGDGSVTKYFTKVYLNLKVEHEYANFVKKLCRKLFVGASISDFIRKDRGTEEIQISSREVSIFLYDCGFKPKERQIPKWIKCNSNYIKAVIRGLFDTEGCVGIKYFQGENGKYFYKQLTFTNRNENLLKFVETYLRHFDYKPTKKSRKNIYLSNARHLSRYMKEIGSNNPKIARRLKLVKLNGFTYGGLRRMVRHQS